LVIGNTDSNGKEVAMTSPGQRSYQQQVQNNSATFHRNAAYHDQLRRRRQRGPVGVIRRLFGFVFSLVVIAIAVGIFLMIVGQASPDLFNQVKTWFEGLF
jgi:hypothetical protein